VALGMQMVDRVFQVIFARYRRQLGETRLEAAWRRATNTVSAYVAWPVVAASAAVVMGAYSLLGAGAPAQHKRLVQVVAVASGLLTAFLLDRHFKQYLSAPQALAYEESHADAQLVFRFHAICIGIFVTTCALGYALHRAGVKFL
jgi:hypothetical protein